MARLFVIEDGSSVTGATSYVTTVEMDDYFDTMGYDRESLEPAGKETLLNVGSRTIDAYVVWEGQRVRRQQGLQWPRSGVYYPDGLAVPSNEVPPEIKNAVCEAAYAQSQGIDIQPVNQQAGNLKAESVQVDVIKESKEYFEGSSYDRDQITAVDDALAPLLGNGGSRYGAMPIVRV